MGVSSRAPLSLLVEPSACTAAHLGSPPQPASYCGMHPCWPSAPCSPAAPAAAGRPPTFPLKIHPLLLYPPPPAKAAASSSSDQSGCAWYAPAAPAAAGISPTARSASRETARACAPAAAAGGARGAPAQMSAEDVWGVACIQPEQALLVPGAWQKEKPATAGSAAGR